MSKVVFASGAIVVTIRFLITKGDGALMYQRRVPKDLLEQYPGPFIRRSVGTRDLPAAARKVSAFAKQDEARWASLRAHPSTPAHIGALADSQMDQWSMIGRDPSDTLDQHLSAIMDDHLDDGYGEDYQQLKHDPRYRSDFEGALHQLISPLDVELCRRIDQLKNPAMTEPLLSVVLEKYLKAKGAAFQAKSAGGVRRALGIVYAAVGDRPLGGYKRPQADQVRDAMTEQGLKTSSVRRALNDIKAVFNVGRREFDLMSVSNPFEGLTILDEGDDSGRRLPFTNDELRVIAVACRKTDDQARHVIALMVDTGARLAEIVGLRSDDVFLAADVPYVWIRPNKALGRTLKNAQSERKVPLIGLALWAAQSASKAHPWLFPKYASDLNLKADSASATLNKWLKTTTKVHKTCHSFRHSMKDRLREAGAPEDIQKAILGHGTATVSGGYGQGYSVAHLSKHMTSIQLEATLIV